MKIMKKMELNEDINKFKGILHLIFFLLPGWQLPLLRGWLH